MCKSLLLVLFWIQLTIKRSMATKFKMRDDIFTEKSGQHLRLLDQVVWQTHCFHSYVEMHYISQPAVFFPHQLIDWKHTCSTKPTPLSSHLFMPVLPEPHHLVHDALQGGEQGWVQLPLHVHDPATAPHWGSGPNRPWVGGPRVRLSPHWTGLLLSRCICGEWVRGRKDGKRRKKGNQETNFLYLYKFYV